MIAVIDLNETDVNINSFFTSLAICNLTLLLYLPGKPFH